MSRPLVRIEDLTRGYESDKLLFDGFSLSIGVGDFVVLQGKSGSGKSTLANMITGYLTPPRKSIFYRDEDVAKMSTHEMQNYRREIGIVFQDTKLIDNLSVRDNIMYPLKVYGHDSGNIQHRYDQFMGLIGLQGREHAPSKELSWWEKQKVAIARALMHNPAFVLADEPTGNLDKEAARTVADVLLAVHELGNTIMLITHDESLVEYITAQCSTLRTHSLS